MTFCAQKTRKIQFLGRGVLRDEFLPMWELSGWQPEHFLISSYGLKTTSHRPKLHFWLFWKSVFFLSESSSSSDYHFSQLLYSRRDEFLLIWELSGWQPEHFLILSYGPKLHSWPFVHKKRGKPNFWGEEFFGMSSYTCENFQLFIVYNFQFHHMMLKRLPEDLNSIFDIFEQSDVFFFLRLLFCFSNFIK